jgi:hypothetical protein
MRLAERKRRGNENLAHGAVLRPGKKDVRGGVGEQGVDPVQRAYDIGHGAGLNAPGAAIAIGRDCKGRLDAPSQILIVKIIIGVLVEIVLEFSVASSSISRLPKDGGTVSRGRAGSEGRQRHRSWLPGENGLDDVGRERVSRRTRPT